MAVSDIHVGHNGNKPMTEELFPDSPDDSLILAGDVSEKTDDIRWALKLLRSRFAKVIWIPGNHELWTTAKDPVQIHGAPRYEYLVNMCRELDVVTPEDPFPVWEGDEGPVTVVPMFLLYDYSFPPEGARDKEHGLDILRGTRTSSPPTSSCSRRSRMQRATRGAGRRNRIHPGTAGTRSPKAQKPFWRTISRWSGSPRTCSCIRSSRCGAEPPRPPTGM